MSISVNQPGSQFNWVGSSRKAIVFIDAHLEDSDVLVQGTIPGSEVHLLGTSDQQNFNDQNSPDNSPLSLVMGLHRITSILSGRTDIGSVHLLTHGSAGQLKLGRETLNQDNLAEYATILRQWFSAARAHAPQHEPPELLLYGCNIAQGQAGRAFVNQLQEIVGIPVAAASHPIGATTQGHQWQLNWGQVKSPVALTSIAQMQYAGQLNTASEQDPVPLITGRIITDFFGGQDNAFSVAVTPTGNIFTGGKAATGSSNQEDFAIVSYLKDGNLNLAFGGDGKVSTDFSGGNDVIYSILPTADGKLLVAGSATNSLGNTDFAIARYLSNGELDLDFGTNGKVLADINGGDDAIFSITVDESNNIIVGGNAAKSPTGDKDFALARYSSTGILDTSFGTNGIAITDFAGGTDAIWSVILDEDSILVGGHAQSNSNTGVDFALARYSQDGILDSSFGTEGKTTTDLGDGNSLSNDYAWNVSTDGSGRIRLGGYSNIANLDEAIAITTYNSNGLIDSSFGDNGRFRDNYLNVNNHGESITLDGEGNLFIAGDNGSDIALVRIALPEVPPHYPSNNFNQDGTSEILWRSKGTGGILGWTMHQNNITGTASINANTASLDWVFKGTSDFDQDGNLDLISRNSITGAVKLSLLDSSYQLQEEVAIESEQLPGLEWKLVGIDNFNGDSHSDLLWRHETSGQFLTWYMGGAQGNELIGGDLFDLSLIGLGNQGVFPDLNWQVEATGDFNGDGQADLVWRHGNSGEVAIWAMQDATLVGGYVNDGVADTNWQIVGSGEFNGDGKDDLIWQHQAAGTVYLWNMAEGQAVNGNLMGNVDLDAWRHVA